MATSTPLPTGDFLEAVRSSCKAARTAAGIEIRPESVRKLLLSPALADSFTRLRNNHGVAMPLKFFSIASEINLLAILSLLNFASGYRVPLHAHNGRGAYDTIRAFVFSMFLSSSDSGGADNLLSTAGLRTMSRERVADLMQLPMHVEEPHPDMPAVTIGKLGGPLLELIDLVSKTLKETGQILKTQGYRDLGHFVIEALNEAKKAGAAKELPPLAEVVVERLVRAFPGFRDMWMVDNQPVYVFKKALFLTQALTIRLGPSSTTLGSSHNLPIPDTSGIPVYADNVLPSMLVYLGVIDLSACNRPELRAAFSDIHPEMLLAAWTADKTMTTETVDKPKQVPKDGAHLLHEDAYVLRAAAVDACELIVTEAREMSSSHADLPWLGSMTLPEIDGWLWAVAKDRKDYRALPRFVERDTVFF